MNDRLLLLALAAAALYLYVSTVADDGVAGEDPQSEDFIDTAMTKFDELTATAGPVDSMATSPDMLAMLRKKESLRLTPYQLGDGGWTVGYGHFEKTRAALPLLRNQADAEALFRQDVVARAEKWVKLYVTVDLRQNEFDALVSIAFNMSPQSFKKFAARVNAGEGIDGIAQQSVAWVPPHLQNGISNRRKAETDVFNYGIYA